jgi:regulator of protease activity HflC (stomatin/prohibitin superfamily)
MATIVKNPALSPRTAEFARKVADCKSHRPSCFELVVHGLGVLVTLPLLGLPGLYTVPTNTTVAIFRFGKLTGVLRRPGIHWIAPGYTAVVSFAGQQTVRLADLNVIDAAGNPIIVRAILEYCVEDAAALHIATNSSITVLLNMAEQVVREACSRWPLLGEEGKDIRSRTAEISAAMVGELQGDASVFGVSVQRLAIVEARYSPEIAPQMLMKQQALAMVAAREAIVAGALNVVKDVLQTFPEMSREGRERLVSSMLVTLTSQTHTTPVLPLNG